MNRQSLNWLSSVIGLVAILTVGFVIVQVLNYDRTSVESDYVTAYPPPEESASPTSQLPPEKATIEQMGLETQEAAAQTPYWIATVWPSPTLGPTSTPDLSYVPHREAGAGIIISDTASVPGWSLAVYNVWYEIPKGIQVFAGVTDDPTQGAIAVLTPYTDIFEPEVYLTPLKAGMIQVTDAQGERLVLSSLDGGTIFYFDVPSRQFVDSLTAPNPPTVTPMPTFTPSPTLPLYTPAASDTPPPYPVLSATPDVTQSVPNP